MGAKNRKNILRKMGNRELEVLEVQAVWGGDFEVQRGVIIKTRKVGKLRAVENSAAGVEDMRVNI